jgi:glycosyltransferase involved in cell wall biosynthesis
MQASGVVTTLNNEATLAACLQSLQAVCSEIIVLDSGSTDQTAAIAEQHGAKIYTQAFAGYAPQKRAAIAKASHDWIVLLDSDEALDARAIAAIKVELDHGSPRAPAFSIARSELIFWRFQHPFSAHNYFVRVFDRRQARISDHAVHESVQVNGRALRVPGMIIHRGDLSIENKVAKLNRYSSLAVSGKKSRAKLALLLRISVYPLWYFFRAYVLRRQFLNGVAGWINSVELAHYAFLKYAKLYERSQSKTQFPKD